MKAVLRGKPLGHPLHPLLVHCPIGLFVLSFVLDVASRFHREDAVLGNASFYCMSVAVIAALLAAVPGLADYTSIRRDHPAKKIGLAHLFLNVTAVVLYAVNLAIRYSAGFTVTPLTLSLSVAGLVLISISGYLGGKMIYDFGIGVGRHRRETPAPNKTLVVRQNDNGPTPIVKADTLRDNDTLRVQVGEITLAIARCAGNVCAFQEFCTHRFGPLSEGVLHDCAIECPWHRSRFDVRNGKVIAGPAKVGLKTYRTEIRDGMICVWMEEE